MKLTSDTKANKELIVDPAKIEPNKDKITAGREKKENKPDVDLGKESGVSRDQCEFMYDLKKNFFTVR